ncbi:MAG: hypothetical protein HQL01_14455 [Nitrospirae bacterium]|nr:hypothetical protein [Nitrospirota bacterium]
MPNEIVLWNAKLPKEGRLKFRDEYYATIEECAKKKKSLEISNGSPEHAARLMETFFKYGRKRVFIFTGKLEHVYDADDMIDEALTFLNKPDCSLTIAFADKGVLDTDIKNHAFIKGIISDSNAAKKFKLYDAREWFSEISHFALMDNSAYRYEIDHDKSQAIANFNDVKTVQRLEAIAESITGNSKEISFDGGSA